MNTTSMDIIYKVRLSDDPKFNYMVQEERHYDSGGVVRTTISWWHSFFEATAEAERLNKESGG